MGCEVRGTYEVLDILEIAGRLPLYVFLHSWSVFFKTYKVACGKNTLLYSHVMLYHVAERFRELLTGDIAHYLYYESGGRQNTELHDMITFLHGKGIDPSS